MCFVSKSKRIKRAWRNTTCYKVVENTNRGLWSWVKDYHYEIGVKQPEVDLHFKPLTNKYYAVYEGYHSSKSRKPIARSFYMKNGYNPVLVKCIIPKGSKYMSGKNREYVSSSIIVKEIV